MMTERPALEVNHEAIASLCQKWQVSRLALFGSILRPDFDPRRSDVDVLVSFQPEARVGLIAMERIRDELARVFGRRVDLLTPDGVQPDLLARIHSSSEVLYAHP